LKRGALGNRRLNLLELHQAGPATGSAVTVTIPIIRFAMFLLTNAVHSRRKRGMNQTL
jgi:hypothetical protein